MTDTINPSVAMTLEEAVGEVLGVLTGLSLAYEPEYDRFRSITRFLNRALRSNALEAEWSYYHELIRLGPLVEGQQVFTITTDYRFRVINDDAVRFIDANDIPQMWAYFLPRDALHKYRNRSGMWASVTRNQLTLSRPVPDLGGEEYRLEIPVMREPKLFVLPTDPAVEVDADVLAQLVDFDFPDVVIARAAWLCAQADPVMQPRAQTLEDQYKTLMYQLIERDSANTDTPYQNEFIVPVQNDIHGGRHVRQWPVANWR